jgi:hypothetical protein
MFLLWQTMLLTIGNLEEMLAKQFVRAVLRPPAGEEGLDCKNLSWQNYVKHGGAHHEVWVKHKQSMT